MTDWQPIETAPRVERAVAGASGPAVLLANKSGVWIGKHYPVGISGWKFKNPWIGWAAKNIPDTTPTHWMPLPEPPEGSG